MYPEISRITRRLSLPTGAPAITFWTNFWTSLAPVRAITRLLYDQGTDQATFGSLQLNYRIPFRRFSQYNACESRVIGVVLEFSGSHRFVVKDL